MTHAHPNPVRRRAAVGRPVQRLVAVTIAALLAAAFILVVVGQSSWAETNDDGNLTVEVTDGVEASPSPTHTPGPPFTPPGPPTTPPGPPFTPPHNPGTPQAPIPGQVTQATILDPAAADDALGGDAASIGGVLAMSGLSAEAAPSFGMGNGTLTLSFVVRNTSREVFDASARFWVDNLVGMRLADIAEVEVQRLEPDETRRVLVRVDGLGQHVVLRNYVTLSPPTTVDGVALSPMTRNITISVPPLFSISLISGIGALSGLAWWAVRAGGLRLRWGWWGR